MSTKGVNSAINLETEGSRFLAMKTASSKTDSESDPNILDSVPFEEAGNLIQKFKTTISQACPGYQKGAWQKFRPKCIPFGSQSTISLPPWNSIKFTYTPVGCIPAKLRKIENVLVKVNKRAIMIINIFNESFNILGGSKKMYLPLVFRCWLRANIVAEISDYLERSNANSNPDGIIWTLLLPFYIRGETPNRAEMSVIAGQVPQIGDQRPNWDSPTAKLKTICTREF
uniref:MAT1-2-5 n=1 Tax=Pseudogymnoascus destructans TaxID=655981 RepID=A0A0D3MES0_9PEZI|nr:MAT1-2-5 [Pseudogymnoascus destructans]AIG95713.1 MAT1-2-5 [Pseudogymnoascus destructans]